ncbi:MAG: trifunctional transcriptional regulator/proline dehydrogenase/L-glutamate gamma-semialdehyde dehydrogenase [Lautropia sp.]|nr:trifunctional transcriptional regulator/proline dehydrogenase/L-glutamate gamma-semialdehyde dehydrogenase [Lautropia sp.]
MSHTHLNIKVEEALHNRLKQVADRNNRTLPWLVKQALLSYMENIERGHLPPELQAGAPGLKASGIDGRPPTADGTQPFLAFAQDIAPQTPQRAAITAAWRRPEPECVSWLLKQAEEPALVAEPYTSRVKALARQLVEGLRRRQKGGSGVEALIQEFSLSSQEGVALMCLAEALLRIPDRETRDALIRDKISHGDWKSHLGHSPSVFVNATTWGLMLTGKLVSTNSESSLSSALTRLIGKGGEPLIRKSVDMAMRMMGEQFVTGETIEQALANARKYEARGFRYSYDMLGEAAATDEDAQKYLMAYEMAIHAIGKAANGRGIYEGPGISIKLSALHPRYSRAQADRVFGELMPRLRHLALLARRYDIALNIDAEEADRLELSLDLLESLCFDPALASWNGIGFVVQAYQKRCPYVIDHLIDLGRRSRHRLMIRLVKGAYWDSEIKRAQLDGMEGYPVYTRKVYTDVSYLVCAQKMLRAPDAIYPQFATHNARTLATIYEMAGQNYYPGQYEFQCLHGMGEPLYEQVTGPTAEGGLNRPCRIYAPVGTYETLLAYLVRRLLENGANTSFVNQVSDPNTPTDKLIADPIAEAAAISPTGAPHPMIPLPAELYAKEGFGYRENSAGVDLANEQKLAALSTGLMASGTIPWLAVPASHQAQEGGNRHGAETGFADDSQRSPAPPAGAKAVRNPANHEDVVGHVLEATPADLDNILKAAGAAAPGWQATPVGERADCLVRAARIMEDRTPILMGLVIREAGKSLPNAIAEIREAVDFLRYYANQVRAEFANDTHQPLGTILCISPWNFPLAIFSGQVAAALAAGNTVLAKPAEQTPLIAAEAVRILHEAGVPRDVLQLVPGDGVQVGAPLVADARVNGVMFTGSTEVARIIAATLAERLDRHGHPVPLIAETGGQNCMIVDSSALTEQVVQDVLVSAFDSAGQRCSALRVLCVQEDSADRVLTMLDGATRELRQGNPELLGTDVGPVIDQEARDTIVNYIDSMRAKGAKVSQPALERADQAALAAGTFVPPTIIEIRSIRELGREVFGPVLHVLRYRRDELGALMKDINSTGYGLTFGVHTRIDETIEQLLDGVNAGNLYVNRNIVGAVVGVQPFGGEGLSGTGPKAGGPLYLTRLLSARPLGRLPAHDESRQLMDTMDSWLAKTGIAKADTEALQRYNHALLEASSAEAEQTMPGPTGESNVYRQQGRGRVLCVAATPLGALAQVLSCLATGNTALLPDGTAGGQLADELPTLLKKRVQRIPAGEIDTGHFEAALYEGELEGLKALNRRLAARSGPIVNLQSLSSGQIRQGQHYRSELLLAERSISINTAAAGGNASLMTIG